MDDSSEEIKEVYAHFGLAIYLAQVLEHGIVNALVVADHIPNKLGSYFSQQQWEADIDGIYGKHFAKTLGDMIKALRKVIDVPADLEEILSKSLKRRNWLAHDYFKERAAELMSSAGRETMIEELVEAQQLFVQADNALEQVTIPLRDKFGMTAEAIQKVYDEWVASL